MNHDVRGNRKLVWKEVSCNRIKDGNGRLVLGEDEAQRITLRVFII